MKIGTPKGLERRQDFFSTAARMFVEKGFNATSMSDIAAELKITKAGLYYYYESKQELFYQIVICGLNLLKTEVLIPAGEIADCEDRLRFIVISHARLAAEGNHAVVIISHDMNALTAPQRQHIMHLRRIYFEFVGETLTALSAAGKLRKIDIETATLTLFGMILWLSRLFRADSKLSIEPVCRDVCEIILNGLMENHFAQRQSSGVRQIDVCCVSQQNSRI